MTATKTARRSPTLAAAGPADLPQLDRFKEESRRQARSTQRGAGRISAQYTKGLDAAVSTTIAESILWSNPLPPVGYDRVVEACSFTGIATVAAGANYARFVLKVRRRRISTGAESLGELKSAATQWPAWRPVEFELNGKSPILKPGDVITVALEKAGAAPGVVTPAGVVELWVRDV